MASQSGKGGPKNSDPGASSIWGGRFDGGPDAIMEEINASIDFDQRLAAEDIAGSIAHVRMLAKQGIVDQGDADTIVGGLETVRDEIAGGTFEFKRSLEDIHMNVESRLAEIVGDAAGRLHTARSRNDQVATDFKLWVRGTIDTLDAGLKDLQSALIERAEAEAATVMPGFTHLQGAQPVTLGHYLLAYVEMLGRDRSRFTDCRRRLNECPLGVAALAGTSFPIDRNATAEALGFDRPTANSMDTVSDRDFALEFLSTATILAVHLSRFAEEMVIWCSQQFGFATFTDAYSTGSSIMPQKRNPDAAELVRAKVGRIAGAFQGLVIVMKGLPLTYGKDMQEDKEAVFDAADNLALAVAATAGMVRDLEFDRDKMRTDAGRGFSTATDLADWLVRALGMPFRQAHHVTGELVRKAEAKACLLEDLSLADMQKVDPAITDDVYSVLGVDQSVNSRTSFGGTAPENVKKAARDARSRFLD